MTSSKKQFRRNKPLYHGIFVIIVSLQFSLSILQPPLLLEAVQTMEQETIMDELVETSAPDDTINLAENVESIIPTVENSDENDLNEDANDLSSSSEGGETKRGHWGATSPPSVATATIATTTATGSSAATITASAFVKKKIDSSSSDNNTQLVDDPTTENTKHHPNIHPHHWFKTNSPKAGGGSQEQRHHSPVLSHLPPEGFVISAHIVTNPNDGLSYFADTIPLSEPDTDESSSTFPNIQIPYFECGALGSTTSPIVNIKHVTFRAFPANANPTQFVPSAEVHLIVALSSLDIIVSGNQEEVRTFDKGSVIFMEDLFGRGHKIRASSSTQQNLDNAPSGEGITTGNPTTTKSTMTNPSTSVGEDLSILILSLRGSNHHHYHYHSSSAVDQQHREQYYKNLLGLKNMKTCAEGSLAGATAIPHSTSSSTVDGGTNNSDVAASQPQSESVDINDEVATLMDDNEELSPLESTGEASTTKNSSSQESGKEPFGFVSSLISNQIQETQRNIFNIEDLIPSKRRVLLSSIGVGLSTISAVFLSKVAPLQLAVGVGGLCIIGGGTVGIVKGGEWLCDEYDAYIEKKTIESNLQVDFDDIAY